MWYCQQDGRKASLRTERRMKRGDADSSDTAGGLNGRFPAQALGRLPAAHGGIPVFKQRFRYGGMACSGRLPTLQSGWQYAKVIGRVSPGDREEARIRCRRQYWRAVSCHQLPSSDLEGMGTWAEPDMPRARFSRKKNQDYLPSKRGTPGHDEESLATSWKTIRSM